MRMIVQENIAIIIKLSRFSTNIALNKTISEQTKQLRCLNLQKNPIN